MNFKTMKVGTRLALGYAIVLVLLLVIVGAGVMKMRTMQERVDEITDFNNIQIANIGTLKDSLMERAIILRNLGLLTDMNAMRTEAERMRELEKMYAERIVLLEKSLGAPDTSPEEKALFATIREQERIAMPLMAEAEKLGLARQVAEAGAAPRDARRRGPAGRYRRCLATPPHRGARGKISL